MMGQERISITEQITLIILALLDDSAAFKQYEAEKFTNELVIDDVKSTTGSLLSNLQISFRYTPESERVAHLHPTTYQLYIGYQKSGETTKTALITLEALIHDEWIHQPLRNVASVADKIQEYGLE